MEKTEKMEPKDFLADIRRRKEELYKQLSVLNREEYKWEQEQEIIDAEETAGKHFMKTSPSETAIFRVNGHRKESFGELMIYGEGIMCAKFASGDIYVSAQTEQVIEISELLKEWKEITEEEYKTNKKEFFDIFNK